jgi:predicted DNA binding protein
MLIDDIRNHLAVANEDQRKRRGAVLLREAAAEIERLRGVICDLHAQESQRLQPDRPTLTDAEREAIATALAYLREDIDERGIEIDAATLRGLLERTDRT